MNNVNMCNFDEKLFDELLSRGLCSGGGNGNRDGGQVCVEQALALACGITPEPGEDVTDAPSCALPEARSFAMRLNDSFGWPTDEARAKGLRSLAIAQIGTANLDGKEFSRRLAEATIREIVPIALLAAAKRFMVSYPEYAKKLRLAADRCVKEGTENAARYAQKIAAASAAAADYAAYAAAAAASAASAASAAAAASADADAAAYAVASDADAADAAAAADAADYAAAAAYKTMSAAADIGTRILNEMRTESES